MQFKKLTKRLISGAIVVSHLGVIAMPAMAAIQQETFGRAKPGTEGSVSQSDLEKMRELVKGLKQKTSALVPNAKLGAEKARALLAQRQNLEQGAAQEILNLRAGIQREIQQNLAELNKDAEHIKAKKLPAIIQQRHDAVVQKIHQRQAIMEVLLDQLATAQTQKDEQARETALDSINKQMEQWEPKKFQTDYKKLPWGSPNATAPKPITANTLASMGKVMQQYKIKGEQLTFNPVFTQKDPSGLNPQELWENALPTVGKTTSIGQWQTIAYNGMTLADQNQWPVLASLPVEVQPADLAANEDVQITPEIQALANQLDKNPAKIYKWVYDNIVYIPTYGSIQGSAYTLETKRGNAFDTSSLLIALLRASGIPARYVYGTIDVPSEVMKDWVGGVNNLSAAGNLIGQGGIPSTIMTSGGKDVAMRMEHVWVEAKVDYMPSRGAVQGSTNSKAIADSWVPLDASYKRYERIAGIDLKANVPLDIKALAEAAIQNADIDDSTGSIKNINTVNVQATLANYQTQIENYIKQQKPNATTGDILGKTTIKSYRSKMLSPVLPYEVVAVVRDYQTLPENMRHYFHLNMFGDVYSQMAGSPALSFKISSTQLQGKPLALSFRPTTKADADVITSYLPKPDANGNFDTANLPKMLPSYAINMTAEITLNGQVLKTGPSYPIGTEIQAQMGFISPNNNWALPNKQFQAGEYHAIGYDMQGISKDQMHRTKIQMEATKVKIQSKQEAQIGTLTNHDITGTIVQAVVQSYFALNDSQDKVAATQANIIKNPYMSFGTFSTSIQGVYSWGVLRQAKLAGMVMDIDRISSNSVDKNNDSRNWANFNASQGPRMSANEHLVPERFFNDPNSQTKNAEGISAIKALEIAANNGQRIYQIDSSNISNILPQLHHDSETINDIRNAVAAGKIVTTSQTKVSLNGWTGTGYVILDPNTGAGAYMIGGGADGGALSMIGGTGVGILFSIILSSFASAAAFGPLGIIFLLLALVILAAITIYLLSSYDDEEDACFWQGFGMGSFAGGLAGAALAKTALNRLMTTRELASAQQWDKIGGILGMILGQVVDRTIPNNTVQSCLS